MAVFVPDYVSGIHLFCCPEQYFISVGCLVFPEMSILHLALGGRSGCFYCGAIIIVLLWRFCVSLWWVHVHTSVVSPKSGRAGSWGVCMWMEAFRFPVLFYSLQVEHGSWACVSIRSDKQTWPQQDSRLWDADAQGDLQTQRLSVQVGHRNQTCHFPYPVCSSNWL